MTVSNNKSYRGQEGISGYGLKLIAVITMFIDHATGTFLLRILNSTRWIPSADRQTWITIYYFLRGVGRMAFPIYCFLLVEGFIHTRSRVRYARNLFLFALLSEIPFDMAFQKSFFDMSYQNVFWELLLGLIMLCMINFVDKQFAGKTDLAWILVNKMINIGIAFGMAYLADQVLLCDYGRSGIIAIFVMYSLYQERVVGFALGVAMLVLFSSYLEIPAFLMVLPMMKYNGRRGKQSVFMKYFFYAFYPLHLFLLSMGCYLLGLGI